MFWLELSLELYLETSHENCLTSYVVLILCSGKCLECLLAADETLLTSSEQSPGSKKHNEMWLEV